MNNSAYIGQAGTGKTTKIITKLEAILENIEFKEHECILAITYMHGSRKRLEAKLGFLRKKGINVKCVTIDAFCFNLLQRYKRVIGRTEQFVVDEDENKYEVSDDGSKVSIGIKNVRKIALEILEHELVQNILKFSYPIIVVDEFQDCIEEQLEVVKSISKNECLLLAADDFQSLTNDLTSEAVDWLRNSIENEELEEIHRTEQPDILETAKSLRLNEKCDNPITIECVPSPNLAAWMISAHMQWDSKKYFGMGLKGRTVAIISPVGPTADAFVKSTLERLNSAFEKKTKTTSYTLYPKPFVVESEKRRTSKDVLKLCDGFETGAPISIEQLEKWSEHVDIVVRLSVSRAKRVLSLRNITEISSKEFTEIVSSRLHFVTTFIKKHKETRIFLTVHGAKNREFDDVFILWPNYTLNKGEEVYLRKLLYNAVTRAKRKVILIIQDKDFKPFKGVVSKRSQEAPLNLLLPTE